MGAARNRVVVPAALRVLERLKDSIPAAEIVLSAAGKQPLDDLSAWT